MWDTALLLSRFGFCIYIHRTARFTGSERRRGEAAQLTRILLPLILLEGFPAKADGGQSEAEQDLPPSPSEIAFQLQSPAAALEGRCKAPGKAGSPPQQAGHGPFTRTKLRPLTSATPGSPDGATTRPGRGTGTPIPNPPAPLRAARPSPTEPLPVFQKPFPNSATPQPLSPSGLGKRLRRGGGEGPGPEPRQGRSGAALGAAAPHACAIGTAPPAHPPLPLPPTTAAAQMAAV